MNKYVDADALKERLSEWEKEYIRTNGGVVSLEILVDEMPAADVAPVRHGTWKNTKRLYTRECSVCNSAYMLGKGWKYCPVCGARMDA